MADQEIQEQPTTATQLKEEYYQYQLKTADGNTIVLSKEQFQQMQEGILATTEDGQQYVEGIMGEEGEEHGEGDEEMVVDGVHHGDPNGEVATQQIHIDADGNILTPSQMHDLVTFHSMDAQGNILTQGTGEGVEMTEQVSYDTVTTYGKMLIFNVVVV